MNPPPASPATPAATLADLKPGDEVAIVAGVVPETPDEPSVKPGDIRWTAWPGGKHKQPMVEPYRVRVDDGLPQRDLESLWCKEVWGDGVNIHPRYLYPTEGDAWDAYSDDCDRRAAELIQEAEEIGRTASRARQAASRARMMDRVMLARSLGLLALIRLVSALEAIEAETKGDQV